MQPKLSKSAKIWIPSALILFFLAPIFVITIGKEIFLVGKMLPQSPQSTPQVASQPISSSNSSDQDVIDLINKAVKAEVHENFDLSLSLINLLLASLTALPFISGFFLWSLKKQIEKKLSEQANASMQEEIRVASQKIETAIGTANQEIAAAIEAANKEIETAIGTAKNLANQEIQALLDLRRAELKALGFNEVLKLIQFAIKEGVHPMIEQEYRVLFQQAFVDGFPTESFVKHLSQETRLRLDEYVKFFQSLAKTYADDDFFQARDHIWLGDACFILGQYSSAHDYYEAAQKLEAAQEFNRSYSRSLHRLGNGKLALKNYEEAIHCYEEAIHYADENSPEFRPDRHAWLYYNLGQAYYQLCNYEKAIENYQKTHQYNQDLYHSFYWQGNALSGLGRFIEAIDCFKQAHKTLKQLKAAHQVQDEEFKTDYKWIIHGTGDAFRKTGDSCHNLSYSIVHQCGGIDQVPIQSMTCPQRIKYYKWAIRYYNLSERIDGTNIETLHKRGKAYRELGKYDQAEADFRKAIDLATKAGDLNDRCNLLANMANLLSYSTQSTQPVEKPSANENLAKAAVDREQEIAEMFAIALEQCQTRRLKAKADSQDILEQFYSYFDTARCYSLQGEVTQADRYMQYALALCPPEKQALAKRWARSDSDFKNWYWYDRTQNGKAQVVQV